MRLFEDFLDDDSIIRSVDVRTTVPALPDIYDPEFEVLVRLQKTDTDADVFLDDEQEEAELIENDKNRLYSVLENARFVKNYSEIVVTQNNASESLGIGDGSEFVPNEIECSDLFYNFAFSHRFVHLKDVVLFIYRLYAAVNNMRQVSFRSEFLCYLSNRQPTSEKFDIQVKRDWLVTKIWNPYHIVEAVEKRPIAQKNMGQDRFYLFDAIAGRFFVADVCPTDLWVQSRREASDLSEFCLSLYSEKD